MTGRISTAATATAASERSLCGERQNRGERDAKAEDHRPERPLFGIEAGAPVPVEHRGAEQGGAGQPRDDRQRRQLQHDVQDVHGSFRPAIADQASFNASAIREIASGGIVG